jgi:hypothetical protein
VLRTLSANRPNRISCVQAYAYQPLSELNEPHKRAKLGRETTKSPQFSSGPLAHSLCSTHPTLNPKLRRFRKVHKGSRSFAKVHKGLQSFAKVHEGSHRFTKVQEHLRTFKCSFMKVHEGLRRFANIQIWLYKGLQMFKPRFHQQKTSCYTCYSATPP